VLTAVRYLADTSAIIRLIRPETAARLAPLIEAGQVATCGVVDLALFGLVTEPAELTGLRNSRALAFPWLATTDDDLRRALEIQVALTEQRQHWLELIVAAVAERHQVTVLHHNAVFDGIAQVTGQAAQWVEK